MRDLLDFLVAEVASGKNLTPESAIDYLKLTARIFDVTNNVRGTSFSEDTKSQIYYRDAIRITSKCPICRGLLDTTKSVSYDHITPIRDGGLGTAENGQMVHPYCNSGMKG
jgi:hypothetical protein